MLAHRVCACAWRLLRVERLEGSLAEPLAAESPAEVAADVVAEALEGGQGPAALPDRLAFDGLAKLARYETALERAFYRALAALRAEQDLRREPAAARRGRRG